LDGPAFFRFGIGVQHENFNASSLRPKPQRASMEIYMLLKPVVALALMTAGLAFGAVRPAAAQSYTNPNRQLKFVVPYQAGGATDVVARLVATKLSESWKQPVVVENHPGGGGIVGNDMVAKAPPDGYTVLFAHHAAYPGARLGFQSAV